MKPEKNKLAPSENRAGTQKEKDPEGYPLYPENEDIYENFKEETDINPEDVSEKKAHNSTNALRRKALDDELSDKDLDIPGSELDDLQEDIGSEDEENNYYSLGGDRHEDLEEDKGS